MPQRRRKPKGLDEDHALAEEAVVAIRALKPEEWIARYAEPLCAAAARSAAAQAFANEFADRVRRSLQRLSEALLTYRNVAPWSPFRPLTSQDPCALAGADLAARVYREVMQALSPASPERRREMEAQRDEVLGKLDRFVQIMKAERAADGAQGEQHGPQ